MAVRAVVFDIGGVLAHTPRTGWDVAWERRLGLEPGGLARRLDQVWRAGDVGQATLAEVERETARILGLDRAALARFMDDLWAEYLGTGNEEVAACFAGLRPRYRTAILSNSFVGARERERERYGFEDMCDVVIYSHEEGMRKPDPRFYALACERLAAEPHEVLFLDDTEACVAGARAAGWTAIRFTGTRQALAALDAHLDAGLGP